MRTRLVIAAVLVFAWGCQGEVAVGDEATQPEASETTEDDGSPTLVESPGDDAEEEATEPDETTPETIYEEPEFTSEQLVTYLRSLSQMLVSRPLNPDEVERVQSDGVDALEPILREWSDEPAFAENARFWMQKKLKASGERDGIDFELPGNLVAHVVSNDLPWSTILTADYCIDADGSQVECDTGAPYSAGVLATRAFLAGNASRFNLGRASTLMEVFACRIYPMDSSLQPYLERESLIPMFQADSIDEQMVEEAKGGFGNGSGCYTCHGQFGAHAQLFVKYDEQGNYVAEADGQQDPDGELGRSVDGLMTSHLEDPQAAASEASQVFGEDVSNLADAGRVIAENEAFWTCMTHNVLQYSFGLGESAEIDHTMLVEVAEDTHEISSEPTYADLVVATFTHPRVILSAVGGSGESNTEGGAQ
jgi:hypothetical protein